MLRRLLAGLLVSSVALVPSAAAQCSTLTVSSSHETGSPFQLVQVDVTGSASHSLHVLAVAETPGGTFLDLGFASLTLGLEEPFVAVPLGVSDLDGGLTRSIHLPADLGVTLFSQSVALELSFDLGPPTLSFCESNVAEVTL